MMTMFNNGFLLVFLAVLAPSLGSQPGPNELPDKLSALQDDLTQAKTDFQCIFDVADGQCPCLPGASDCFETDLETINTTLCELIADLSGLIEDQPTDCPALEGCAAVVTGNQNILAVVDPVGTILPSIFAVDVVSELVIVGDSEALYSIYYLVNNGGGFLIRQQDLPASFDSGFYTSPPGETGKGISFLDGVAFVSVIGEASVLVAIDSTGSRTLLAFLGCAGTVREFDGRIYYGDCNTIRCVDPDGSNQEERVKFSMNIVSFDVIDDDRTVFCDGAGGLWIYNNATNCFKLVDCTDETCEDVRINDCDGRVYVAYSGINYLDIFNTASCQSEGTLEYASVASTQPRVDFRPPCDVIVEAEVEVEAEVIKPGWSGWSGWTSWAGLAK